MEPSKDELALAIELATISYVSIAANSMKNDTLIYEVRTDNTLIMNEVIEDAIGHFAVKSDVYHIAKEGLSLVFSSKYIEYKYNLHESYYELNPEVQFKHITHVVSKPKGFLDERNFNKKYGNKSLERHEVLFCAEKIPVTVLRAVKKEFEDCYYQLMGLRSYYACDEKAFTKNKKNK